MTNENDSNTPAANPQGQSSRQPPVIPPAPPQGEISPNPNDRPTNQQETAQELARQHGYQLSCKTMVIPP